MTRKSAMPEKVLGSAILMRLKLHNRGAKPRLTTFFQSTCTSIDAAEERMKEMNLVIEALSVKGISENDLASYSILFRKPEEALAMRNQIIERIQMFGFGHCRAGKMADALVTNASMAGVAPDVSNIDILFTMVLASLESNIPGQTVCKVIKENLGVITPRGFAISCIETARRQGYSPDVTEDYLVSKLSLALRLLQTE